MALFPHTLPNGIEIRYKVEALGAFLYVEYPTGIDISLFSSSEAYPIEEIEKVFGKTGPAVYHGEDEGRVWEMWGLVG